MMSLASRGYASKLLVFVVCLLYYGVRAEDLCYTVQHTTRSGKSSTTQTELVLPVTAFPALHPKVLNESLCGGVEESDKDGIPTTSSFPRYEGSTRNYGWNCWDTTPGVDTFYAYDYPERYIANTGYEEPEAALLFFVLDEAQNVHFGMIFDHPDNTTGLATLRLAVTPESVGEGLNLEVADNYHIDEDSFNIGCRDYPENWEDYSYETCAMYESNQYCTSTGGQGSGAPHITGSGAR
ncbi:hypothetical protein CYMTET_26897 [Cymbomonas tetramitiformis]|uniref:Uncharacterized protein n=1 Tax=Cymbomonas tetramitiformis TaxID=36881 RepID=A0AAE0FQV9_9CHLO|nr:hypothetical protein CYMTET_26897 [Cymbomonas tetramitiformis]